MKEPKLFAEIRKSRARAEKAGKHAPPPPVGPQFVGTVETPANPNPPNNYIAQTLDECTTAAHCEELLAHAKQHGYSEEGQTVQLIRAKLAGLKKGALPNTLSVKALHRESAWGRPRTETSETPPTRATKAPRKRGGAR